MEHNLVSVVIPLYNSARFIDQTLTAVFQSNYTPFEVVLVDDGSTDDTRDVLVEKRWMDKVRYIAQENKGISGARNTGILTANGRYISLLDHDDLPRPEKLRCLIDYLETHPQYKMVYTPVIMEGEHVANGKPRRPKWILRYEGDLFESLFYRNHISPSSTLFEREAMITAGLFDESYRISEEHEFFLRFSARYMIGYVDMPLTRYSWRYDNTSVRMAAEIPDAELRLFNQHYPTLKKKSRRADEIYRKSLGNGFASKAKVCFQRHEYLEARRYTARAIKMEPFRMKYYGRYVKALLAPIFTTP